MPLPNLAEQLVQQRRLLRALEEGEGRGEVALCRRTVLRWEDLGEMRLQPVGRRRLVLRGDPVVERSAHRRRRRTMRRITSQRHTDDLLESGIEIVDLLLQIG